MTLRLAADTGTSATDKVTLVDVIDGTSSPNAIVHFTVDGKAVTQTAVADRTGAWRFTPAGLADGAHTVVASETDAAGNTGSAALAFTLDTKAPVVTTALATDTGASATDQVTSNAALAGRAEAGSTVRFTVDGKAVAQTAVADRTGAWTFTPAGLADGAHTVVASETDAAGNTGSAALAFTLDTTPPTIAITSAGGTTNGKSQTIAGTVAGAAAGSTVTVYDGAVAAGTTTVKADGSWSTGVTLASGANAITARVADTAGNTGTSNTVTYTVP